MQEQSMNNTHLPFTYLPLMSPMINELLAALSKAQGQMMTAGKGAYNTVYKSYYADWETIKEVSRIPLAENGLSVVQSPVQIDRDYKVLWTVLGHSSGQFISSTWHINPKPIETREGKIIDVRVQQVGGEVTFIKRYAFASIIGLSLGEDDDGNTASGKNVNKIPSKSNTTNDNNDGNTIITKENFEMLDEALSGFGNETWLRTQVLEHNKIQKLNDLPLSKFQSVIQFLLDNGKD